MPVIEQNGRLSIVRLDLAPGEVPFLLKRHRTEYEGSESVEGKARKLKAADFSAEEARGFVNSVFLWSKNTRNLSRVQQASNSQFETAFENASQLIDNGDVPKAIDTLCKIPHLGVSYASKIGRFLDPEKCVILDSVIRGRLGYSNDAGGYAAFLGDCRDMLKMLKASPGLDSELRATLRICDVEAALFMKAKE